MKRKLLLYLLIILNLNFLSKSSNSLKKPFTKEIVSSSIRFIVILGIISSIPLKIYQVIFSNNIKNNIKNIEIINENINKIDENINKINKHWNFFIRCNNNLKNYLDEQKKKFEKLFR